MMQTERPHVCLHGHTVFQRRKRRQAIDNLLAHFGLLFLLGRWALGQSCQEYHGSVGLGLLACLPRWCDAWAAARRVPQADSVFLNMPNLHFLPCSPVTSQVRCLLSYRNALGSTS